MLQTSRRPTVGRLATTSAPRSHVCHFRSPLTSRRAPAATRAVPLKVSEEELEVELANRDTAIIIDFYATWCGPCLMLAKELEKVAEELGDKVRVLKVDVDVSTKISGALQIQGLPTMIFIGTDTSKPALRMEGYVPAATIKEILQNDV